MKSMTGVIVATCYSSWFTGCLAGAASLSRRGVTTTAISIQPVSSIASAGHGSNIIITTTFSQSTYTYTYAPPTSLGTATTSGSANQSWGLVPPIMPLPFPVPPTMPPPEAPAIPGEPGEGEPGKPKQFSLTIPTPSCFANTATLTAASCTELVSVSSYLLKSTLTDCSSTYSTTSGCAVTGSATTVTIAPNIPETISTVDEQIGDDVGQVYFDPYPQDDPTRISDIFIHDFGLGPERDPANTNGKLICSAQSTAVPSFFQANALVRLVTYHMHHLQANTEMPVE